MKFVAVYDRDTKDYSGKDRLGFLENAKEIHIRQTINGENDLEFDLPNGDSKWAIVEPESIVGYDGKYFRIKSIDGRHITAISLIQDACRTHIQYIGDMINTPTNEIVEEIFKTTPYVTVLSEKELRELGLEPVTDRIDFFEQSKMTPIGCLKLLMETLNKYRIHSELYIDNRNIGLVRKLGKDRGVRIDPKYNSRDIKVEYTTYGMITKLYPYGKDDLPIGEVPYIKSPNYDILGEYEAFCNFDEISDVDDLRSAAEYQFSPDNIDRADVPKYSVTAKHLSAKQEIFLGDTVTVVDRDNGITSKQRVIMVDTYPKAPEKNNFQAGHPSISIQEGWQTSFMASQYLRLRKNGAGQELKTSALEFMKKNEDVSLKGMNGKMQKIAQYETGALFVSGIYAVAIMDGKIQIGTKDNNAVDGWNWTAVFDGGQVKVGKVFTGELYTDLVSILSEDGTLKIEGNLITMFDKNEILRFQAGTNGNSYLFSLYNENGKRTAYIDDNGNLTICGVFKTGEDGENRVVIDGNGIKSYNSANQLHGIVTNPDGGWQNFRLYKNGKQCFYINLNYLNEGAGLCGSGNELIFLGKNGGVLNGSWVNGAGFKIATEDDIQSLQAQINALKGM